MSNLTETEAINIYYELTQDIKRHRSTASRYIDYLKTTIEIGDLEQATIYRRDIIAHKTAICRLNMILNDVLQFINISDLWN